MMRTLLLASTALIASPAVAQDHSAHQMQEPPAGQANDHSAHTMHQAPVEQAQDHTAHPPQEDQPAESTPHDVHSSHEAQSEAQANPLGQIRATPRAPAQPAQDTMDHAAMGHGPAAQQIPSGPPPARAFEGPQHAADLFFDQQRMAQARSYNHATHGDMKTGTILAERLEAHFADGEEEYAWDITGWYGTALDKFVIKSEGEGAFGGELEEAEVQALWAHAIGPWFDLQAGVRLDIEPDTTAHLAFGAAGLAPYNIHVDGTAFVSDNGDLTARVEAEHDMRLTQKLVLQPRIEFELAAQDIPERDIGAGLYELSIGARLRYEFVPEFAPYVGVEYGAATGRTADIIRARGDDPSGFAVLVGLRTWF
ncbi:copper resistance protein B [Erythrobacter alti]|uniref:copper resistance protein B n=1 Tax=Erythrobacter alti TaxID=1896145 RepID=UPI0030F3EB0C